MSDIAIKEVEVKVPKIQAMTSWLILEDPREEPSKRSQIHLPEEVQARLDAEQANKVRQKILSIGPDCKTKELKVGMEIIVDPRMPGVLVQVDEDLDMVVAYVQENQVLMFFSE